MAEMADVGHLDLSQRSARFDYGRRVGGRNNGGRQDERRDLTASVPSATEDGNLKGDDDNGGKYVSSSSYSLTRHTFGLVLLSVVVLLWVTSNFMTYSIFADGTYSKPYFTTYLNTAGFSVYLVPYAVQYLWRRKRSIWRRMVRWAWEGRIGKAREKVDEEGRGDGGYAYTALPATMATTTTVVLVEQSGIREGQGESEGGEEEDEEEERIQIVGETAAPVTKFTAIQTLRLSAQFCFLWFLANYFAGAAFSYTSVPSGTILSSTSSVWTLFFSSILRVERFTLRKFVAVVTSLLGIVLISTVDINIDTSPPPPSSPSSHSLTTTVTFTILETTVSIGKILLGDVLALLGALLYALYTVLLKFRVASPSPSSPSSVEEQIPMPLFFGFVGLLNTIFLFPPIFILDRLEIEKLVWPPPSAYVSKVLFGNVLITIVSDLAWAYAMLLTTPVVVTVGLGLTIPMAVMGQVMVYGWNIIGVGQSFRYLFGAACVAGGFFGVAGGKG